MPKDVLVVPAAGTIRFLDDAFEAASHAFNTIEYSLSVERQIFNTKLKQQWLISNTNANPVSNPLSMIWSDDSTITGATSKTLNLGTDLSNIRLGSRLLRFSDGSLGIYNKNNGGIDLGIDSLLGGTGKGLVFTSPNEGNIVFNLAAAATDTFSIIGYTANPPNNTTTPNTILMQISKIGEMFLPRYSAGVLTVNASGKLISNTSIPVTQGGTGSTVAPTSNKFLIYNGTAYVASAFDENNFTRSANSETITGTWTFNNNITASITGNSATATTWITGRTISLTGNVTGTSAAFNGSSNLSFATTIASLPAISGANLTSLTAGNLSGTIPSANLSGTYAISISGNAATLSNLSSTDFLRSNVAATKTGGEIFFSSIAASFVRANNTANRATFSITALDTSSVIGVGAHWNTSSWIQNNTLNPGNANLLQINPGTGVTWYAVNNSTEGAAITSWNIRDSVTLWNNAGQWLAGNLNGIIPSANLSGTYAISISGTAATATIFVTGRTISLTGDVTGTSAAFNGSANLSFAVTLASIPAISGANLTTLNASNLSSGTLANARLSTGLVSLTGLTGAGVVTTTATNVFAMRAIGTASSTDIIDRTSGDTRYSQIAATNTFTSDQIISKASPILSLTKNSSGQVSRIIGNLSANARWLIDLGGSVAESGSNVGSDFLIGRHNDAGVYQAAVLTISRATGIATFENTVNATTFVGALTGNASTANTLFTGRTIGITGDVTGTSSAFNGSANLSFATTISNSAVTYAKIQNVTATSRILGRVTAGAGVVEELTVANVWSILGTQTVASIIGLSASGQISSTVAIGTSPLIITSTTLVNNLNVELLNGQNATFYRNASNINSGILPNDRLDVSGTNTTTPLILNSKFLVDQQGNSTNLPINAINTKFYPVDQWWGSLNGTVRASMVRDFLSTFEQGHCLVISPTTAQISFSTGEFISPFCQDIEGFNVSNLLWGTVNAKTITVSFEVLSNITGIFSLAVKNADNTRSYVSSFTINSASTIERKTITIPGDTSGTWVRNNGIGLALLICSVGSTSVTPSSNNTWSTGNFFSAVGATNWASSTSNSIYISAIQIDVGNLRKPFVSQTLQDSEIHCKRYFSRTVNYLYGNTVSLTHLDNIFLPVEMRVVPTLTTSVISESNCASYSAVPNSNRGGIVSGTFNVAGGFINLNVFFNARM